MMSKLTKGLVFGLTVLLVVALAACAAPPEEEKVELPEYNIAFFGDFHMVYAELVTTCTMPACVAAIDLWNDEIGPEIGVKLIPKIYDVGYDFAEAGAVYDRVVATEKPIGMVSVISPSLMANLSKFKEDEVPMCQWFGYGAMHLDGGWAFLPGRAYAQINASFINWWVAEEWTEARKPRVAYACFKGAYTDDLISLMEPWFAQNPDVEYLGCYYHEATAVDLAGYVRDLMKDEPDIILTGLTSVSKPAYYSALKELGYLGKVPNVFPCFGGTDDASRSLGPEFVEGDYDMDTTNAAPGTVMHRAHTTYASRHYGRAFWGPTAPQYAAGTCLILAGVVRAVETVGAANLTGRAVYEEIEGATFSSEEMFGCTGTIKLDPKDRLSGATEAFFSRFINGKHQMVGSTVVDESDVLKGWLK